MFPASPGVLVALTMMRASTSSSRFIAGAWRARRSERALGKCGGAQRNESGREERDGFHMRMREGRWRVGPGSTSGALPIPSERAAMRTAVPQATVSAMSDFDASKNNPRSGMPRS